MAGGVGTAISLVVRWEDAGATSAREREGKRNSDGQGDEFWS